MLALQIDPDGRIATVDLPEDDALHRRALTVRLSGTPVSAVYHRRALMWTLDSGANDGLQSNLVATALASAWRGLDIGSSYFLHGRVIVTGTDGDTPVPLAPPLLAQARSVAAAIAERLTAWRDGHEAQPATPEAAWAAIVADAEAAVNAQAR